MTSLLNAAKALAPQRPDAYFNEAILVQEFKARSGDKAALEEAKALFKTFVDKAANHPRYKDAIVRANERIADIDTILKFTAAPSKP